MVDIDNRVIGHWPDEGIPVKAHIIEQYVQDVRDFSSQYGSDISISYTAYNITGKPSKFPDYGDFPQAFVMRTYGRWWDQAPSKARVIMPQNYGPIHSQDYIDVMFENAVMPLRVSIYETYNPGSVVRIWAGDSKGMWALLWEGFPEQAPHRPRIFSPNISPISFYTNLLRLEFDHSLLDYYTELDAVLLTGVCSVESGNLITVSPRLMPSPTIPQNGITSSSSSSYRSQSSSQSSRSISPDEDKWQPGNGEPRNNTTSHTVTDASSHSSSDCYSSAVTSFVDSRPPTAHSIAHITQQVINLELTTWKSDVDISNSLDELNSLAQHYISLLDDITIATAAAGVPSDSTNLTVGRKLSGVRTSQPPISGAFSQLPDETMLKIFLYLDLISLCRCTRVNKQFYRLASDAMLYTEVGLRPYWNRVSGCTLESLSPRCLYLQQLDLSWCGNYGSITPSTFNTFIEECGKLLTHLRLDCCKFVDNSCIITVAETCRNLKELTLKNVSGISTEGYSRLSKITTFERLDFYRTYIETEPLVCLLKASPKLRHINLGSCVKISVMDEVANALGAYNRDLVSADFWKTYSLTPVGVKALANCKQLEEIDLGWCLGVSIPGECLSALAMSCPKLTKVFLAALRGLTDRDLAHFVIHCPKLSQVDLLGVRNVTPNMCFRMLRDCKELRLLDVSFCDQIPDHLVEWWSQNFTHVSIKKSYQSDGAVFIRNHP